MEALRVAYLLSRTPGYSETFIESEIRAVRAAGVEVAVFPVRTGVGRRVRIAARRPGRVLSHVRALGPGYGLRAVLAAVSAVSLRDALATFDPDVVHAHFVNLPTAVAVLVAADLDRPCTATAHAADFRLDRRPRALRRRLARLSHLFVVAAATARQLEARGVDPAAVPHSVVRASFDGRFRGPVPRRPGGPVHLITVARLVGKKGVDTALDAVGRLVADGREVRYDVYGDGPLRTALQARAAAAGIAPVVTFHGAVPHAVAMEALAAADVAVLPCRRGADGDLDGIPVFLMEAGARGVPVVTTPVSGIPELVDDTRGWLVPPDDPRATAEAIGDALRPDEAARRTAALRRHVEAEFAPSVQAARLVATWRRLAATRSGPAVRRRRRPS